MLHSVHVYEISMDRMVAFLIAILIFCFSISDPIAMAVILFWIMLALLPAFTVWLLRVARGRSGGDDVQKNSPVGLRRRGRRTCVTLFERVKDFNPFHPGRVPLDDPISLDSRLGEGRV